MKNITAEQQRVMVDLQKEYESLDCFQNALQQIAYSLKGLSSEFQVPTVMNIDPEFDEEQFTKSVDDNNQIIYKRTIERTSVSSKLDELIAYFHIEMHNREREIKKTLSINK